jgi:hypothetical protein
MAVRLSALRAVHPLPLGRFLVLIFVRGWVDPVAILRLEGLGQLKIVAKNLTALTSETLIPVYETLRCHIPEDRNLRKKDYLFRVYGQGRFNPHTRGIPCEVWLLVALIHVTFQHRDQVMQPRVVPLAKVHLLYEAEYVIPCIGNLTEEKSCASMFEFPTGAKIP